MIAKFSISYLIILDNTFSANQFVIKINTIFFASESDLVINVFGMSFGYLVLSSAAQRFGPVEF